MLENGKENPKAQCCFYSKVFVGCPTRIRRHLTGERNDLLCSSNHAQNLGLIINK